MYHKNSSKVVKTNTKKQNDIYYSIFSEGSAEVMVW